MALVQHFVQMWVPPDTQGLTPEYEQVDISDRLEGGGLIPLTSGRDADAAITIHQRDATLWVGRLGAGEAVVIPDAPFVHVFLAAGTATFGSDSQALTEGDALRLTAAGAQALRAGSDSAEILVWEAHATAD